MAYKRKTLRLDTSGLDHLLIQLDELGKDVKPAVNYALKHAAVKTRDDTLRALWKSDLPAKGKYSTGATQKSVLHFPKVEWDGDVASIPVGFDFDEPGAGGFLISGTKVNGTPRMKPAKELRKIYKGKPYIKQLQQQMWDDVMRELKKAWFS